MRSVKKFFLIILVLLGLQCSVSATVWEISPWTDDASSGIDSSKTYTHTINFSYQTAPTVNGVEFVLCWGSFANGSANGGGWIDWDDGNNVAGDSYELSRDFHYGNTSIVLSGLTPGGVYELTFFSTAWEDGTRTVTLTDQYGTFTFNQDEYGNNNGIKIVGIYTADADGKLNLTTVGDFHIYAFANCEYTGDLPVVVNQVSPDDFEGGNRFPTDTALTWAEEFSGSLTNPVFDVYFSTDETKVAAMDAEALVSAKQAEFSYSPALDPNALYYWRIATYIDMSDSDPNLVTEVRALRTVFEEEYWTDASWTDDSDSGISTGKVYTHKVNFNSTESAKTLVNGVYFENDGDHSGSDWSLTGAGSGTGQSHNIAGDGGTLATNMYYGADAVLTLTGLTPGEDYVFTKYVQGWGDPKGRLVHFTTSADNRTTTLDGNIDGNGNGHLFKYAYTAPASGELVVTFEPLSSNDTWHHYAFSNEIAVPAYLDPTPLPGASVSYDVELSWELNGDVVNPTYNLKVATDEAMANLAVNETGLSATSLTPYLDSDTEYYWQVEIVEDGGSVIYSSPAWSFVTTPPQEALKVIEWKFDETTGTVAEQTGPTEDADGKLVGFDDPNTPGVSHVAGLVNNGLYLNGRDEYVDVSNAQIYMPTAAGQSFAISGYIRTFDNYGPIFSMRNSDDENPIIDIALGADGVQTQSGKICVLVRDDNYSMSNMNSGIKVNDGRWHNFIVTRIGDKWTLYVDGESRALINGAATGNVDLNLMAIGTSLRWIMDGWGISNSVLRDFHGIMDEFAIWDGELLPSQIAALASIIPGQGDVDFDMETDIDDLASLTSNWLADTNTAVQADAVLEDMETYADGQESVSANWPYTEEDGFGDLVLTVIPDPNLPSHGQILKMDYDFSTGGLHAHIPVELPNRGVALGLYDQMDITLKKLPGCDISDIILDIYDARGKANPADDELYSIGRISMGISEIPVNEWVTVSAAIPDTEDMESCSDLYEISFSIQDGGEDIGTMYIDSIVLTDAAEDCVPQIGQMIPDFNGDCAVDLKDFADIAEGWLSTN